MDNNFNFKTRNVSIVQRSSSVVNSFVSSVELIQAMTYKLKRDTNQNFENLTYNFKMRETWNNTCVSTTLNTRKKIVKTEIITVVITQNVMRTKTKHSQVRNHIQLNRVWVPMREHCHLH